MCQTPQILEIVGSESSSILTPPPHPDVFDGSRHTFNTRIHRILFVSALSEIKFWYLYNSHVRKRYLLAILKLSREEILKDRGASYPSILDIYVHVLDGLRIFFIHTGKREDFVDWQGNTTIEQFKEREKEVDSKVMSYVNSLSETDLDCKVMGSFPLKGVLNHMIEEELQHRGEMNALFWQMNIDPPISDLEDARYIDLHVKGEKCPLCEA